MKGIEEEVVGKSILTKKALMAGQVAEYCETV
jgi:hypothetical protein